jgi:hypothetical protein
MYRREEYQSELSQLRKKTINNFKPIDGANFNDGEVDDLEIALLSKTTNHIKMGK